MFYGDKEISKVYYGGAEIAKIYHGSDLVYQAAQPDPYPVGTVVLEITGAKTGQTTGSVDILGDGVYDAILVGPGGGGASGKWSYAKPGGTLQPRQGCASGGAGGTFVGKLRIKKGSYDYQIPAAGIGVDMGDTKIITLGDLKLGPVYLSGAMGGYKSIDGYATGGSGGQKAFVLDSPTGIEIVSFTINENGSYGSESSTNETLPDVPSAFPPYGFGGGAMYSQDQQTYNDGGVGYIKLVYAGQ